MSLQTEGVFALPGTLEHILASAGELHESQEMAISDAEDGGTMDPDDEQALRAVAFAPAKGENAATSPRVKPEEGTGLAPEVQQLRAVLGEAVSEAVAVKLIR